MVAGTIGLIARATAPNSALYGGIIVLALFLPRIAAFTYLVIAIVALLRLHGDSEPARTPS